MSKLLTTASAIGIAAMIALPDAASARQNVDPGMKTDKSIEVSSARRHYHRYYQHYGYRSYYGPRYGSYGYGPRYGYYGGYNSYAYDPYYRSGFSVGVGPFGFGFGF